MSSITAAINEDVLVCWLNTLNVPSCLLLSDLSEFSEGDVLVDLSQHILLGKQRYAIPFSKPAPGLSPVQKIHYCLKALSSLAAAMLAAKELHMPGDPRLALEALFDARVSDAVARKNMDCIKLIVAFLRHLANGSGKPADLSLLFLVLSFSSSSQLPPPSSSSSSSSSASKDRPRAPAQSAATRGDDDASMDAHGSSISGLHRRQISPGPQRRAASGIDSSSKAREPAEGAAASSAALPPTSRSSVDRVPSQGRRRDATPTNALSSVPAPLTTTTPVTRLVGSANPSLDPLASSTTSVSRRLSLSSSTSSLGSSLHRRSSSAERLFSIPTPPVRRISAVTEEESALASSSASRLRVSPGPGQRRALSSSLSSSSSTTRGRSSSGSGSAASIRSDDARANINININNNNNGGGSSSSSRRGRESTDRRSDLFQPLSRPASVPPRSTSPGPGRRRAGESESKSVTIRLDTNEVFSPSRSGSSSATRKKRSSVSASRRLSPSQRTPAGFAKPPVVTQLTPEQEDLVNWLLALGVDIPGREHGRASVHVESFCEAMHDGLRLCDLAAVLDGHEISGLHRNPTSMGHKMSNISRALKIFRERKRLNPQYLFSNEAILQRDPVSLFGLLGDLKREYKIPPHWKPRYPPLSSGAISAMGQVGSLSPSRGAHGSSSPARDSTILMVSPGRQQQQTPGLPLPLVEPPLRKMKEEVVTWLRRLGFNITDPVTPPHIWQDRFRNGTLLCDVVALLSNSPLPDVHRRPRSIRTARDNVEQALSVLRLQKEIPVMYVWDSESIVRGVDQNMYGLLWHVMHAYPIVNAPAATSGAAGSDAATGAQQQQQQQQQQQLLEQSVLWWIFQLGVLPMTVFTAPKNLDEIMPMIQSGVLLCDLVEKMLGNMQRLTGVFRQPKIKATALANIRKALVTLKSMRNMNNRMLNFEKEILEGDHTIVLGLLEDMHRCYDRVPMRKSADDAPHIVAAAAAGASGANGGGSSSSSSHNPSGVKSPMRSATGDGLKSPTVAFGGKGLALAPVSLQQGQQQSLSEPRPQSQLLIPTELRATVPTPHRMKPGTERFFVVPHAFVVAETDGSRHLLHPPAPGAHDRSQMQSHPYEAAGSSSEPSLGYMLGKWMASLGIHLSSAYVLEGRVVPEFSDGVILCRLIGALENEEIVGVTRQPKSKAASLHNIRKALEVLRRRKNMPLDYLWSEMEIFQGRPDVICGLLEQIRRAYGHRMSQIALAFGKRSTNASPAAEDGMGRAPSRPRSAGPRDGALALHGRMGGVRSATPGGAASPPKTVIVR